MQGPPLPSHTLCKPSALRATTAFHAAPSASASAVLGRRASCWNPNHLFSRPSVRVLRRAHCRANYGCFRDLYSKMRGVAWDGQVDCEKSFCLLVHIRGVLV